MIGINLEKCKIIHQMDVWAKSKDLEPQDTCLDIHSNSNLHHCWWSTQIKIKAYSQRGCISEGQVIREVLCIRRCRRCKLSKRQERAPWWAWINRRPLVRSVTCKIRVWSIQRTDIHEWKLMHIGSRCKDTQLVMEAGGKCLGTNTHLDLTRLWTVSLAQQQWRAGVTSRLDWVLRVVPSSSPWAAGRVRRATSPILR